MTRSTVAAVVLGEPLSCLVDGLCDPASVDSAPSA